MQNIVSNTILPVRNNISKFIGTEQDKIICKSANIRRRIIFIINNKIAKHRPPRWAKLAVFLFTQYPGTAVPRIRQLY